jgi:hypothetical protein
MTENIRYDEYATLEKWPSLEAKKILTGNVLRSVPIYTGTLVGCVRQFLAKPESQRPLYEIFSYKNAGFGKSTLHPFDIVALAERDDFPTS